jgi:hypothetical protein
MGWSLLGLGLIFFRVESGRRRSLAAAGNTEVSVLYYPGRGIQNRAQALRHASLGAKGLAPLAFAKGNFIILCVGKFLIKRARNPC